MSYGPVLWRTYGNAPHSLSAVVGPLMEPQKALVQTAGVLAWACGPWARWSGKAVGEGLGWEWAKDRGVQGKILVQQHTPDLMPLPGLDPPSGGECPQTFLQQKNCPRTPTDVQEANGKVSNNIFTKLSQTAWSPSPPQRHVVQWCEPMTHVNGGMPRHFGWLASVHQLPKTTESTILIWR